MNLESGKGGADTAANAVLVAPELLPLKIIQPRRGWLGLELGDLWRHRDLLYTFAWRDVKVRYKQTVLGCAWAFLQPFAKMVIFSVIFGRFAKMDSEGFPYPIFVFAGLLPWEFFAESLFRSSQSIIEQERLVTKAAFPRLLIPMGALGACIVDYAVSLLILVGLVLYYPSVSLTWSYLALIPLLIATVMAAVGAGALLSALNVAYRDFRYVIPFLVQMWFFVTPVIYPLKVLSEKWRWALALNPMTGIVCAYRSVILGTPLDGTSLAISIAATVLLFFVGMKYFRRIERIFADII